MSTLPIGPAPGSASPQAGPTPLTPTQSADMAWHLHGQSHFATGELEPPIVMVRGEGVHVWDEHGRCYLDAMSGVGNGTLGYAEPRLVEAAARQLTLLPFQHTFGNRTTMPTAELAERLAQLAPCPIAKVFFASSGSEANDSAIAIAWQYWRALGQPRRRKIVALRWAYHGSTIATAALSFIAPAQGPGSTDHTIRVTCPNHYREAEAGETEAEFCQRLAKELEGALLYEGPDTVAAMILEPVMGAGGVVVPPAGYASQVQAVLRRHGVLLIDDEVVCGFGRTGRFWGCESTGFTPDILVCSKGLTAGYAPMSAVMLSPQVCDMLRRNGPVFAHGFSQGGNPVGAAVALEVLALYEERRVLAHVEAMSRVLEAALRPLAEHALVGQVRGRGLMWAVELVADKATHRPFAPRWGIGWHASMFAEAQGVIIRMVGDSLVVVPPLIICPGHIERIASTLRLAIDHAQGVAQEHASRRD